MSSLVANSNLVCMSPQNNLAPHSCLSLQRTGHERSQPTSTKSNWIPLTYLRGGLPTGREQPFRLPNMAFRGKRSWSMRMTCPNQRSLRCLRTSLMLPTLHWLLMSSFLICCNKETPSICRKHRIWKTSSLSTCACEILTMHIHNHPPTCVSVCIRWALYV